MLSDIRKASRKLCVAMRREADPSRARLLCRSTLKAQLVPPPSVVGSLPAQARTQASLLKCRADQKGECERKLARDDSHDAPRKSSSVLILLSGRAALQSTSLDLLSLDLSVLPEDVS